MTLTTTSARADAIGTGTTGPFPFAFRIFGATDLQVVKRFAATGVEQTLLYPADFSVSGVGNTSGGSITLTSALASGDTLSILRNLPITQPTSLRNQGTYYGSAHEDAFDRVVMLIQKQQDTIGRGISLPTTVDPSVVSAVFPVPVAGKMIAWNNAGTALETRAIDSTAIVIPGGGRTVVSASAYLNNNAKFNVYDFGAVVGATDSATAIQSAIAAASAAGGGDVDFPVSGTYTVGAQLTGASNVNLTASGGTVVLQAKAATTFESVIKIDGVANVQLRGLTVDVNRANRIASLAAGQRIVGVYINNAQDVRVIGVTSKNAAGSASGIPGFGFAVGGTTSARVLFAECIAINNGQAGRGCDGFYIGGAQCLIANSISNNNTDTGFVLENCSNSGIKGCSSIDTPAAAAITNITATDLYGNFIDGLSIDNWNASVTGGIQIGCIGSSTGNLINTLVANVTMRRVAGSGPAIYLRRVGTGNVKRLILSNAIVDGAGAGAQGVLIDTGADDILVIGGNICGPTCIQTATGCTDVTISNVQMRPTGTFGVYNAGSSRVRVRNCDIDCGGVANYGIYHDGTATGCSSEFNNIENYVIGRVGYAGTNVPAVLANDTSGFGGLVVGPAHRRAVNWNSGTGEVNIDADGAGTQMSGDYRATGGFRQVLEGWAQTGVAASQTNAVATRVIGATVFIPRAGSLMGIAVRSSNGVTAAGAALTVEIWVNGVASGRTAVMAIGQTTAVLAIAKDATPFAAFAVIEPRVTTPVGWTSTTMNIQIDIEVES